MAELKLRKNKNQGVLLGVLSLPLCFTAAIYYSFAINGEINLKWSFAVTKMSFAFLSLFIISEMVFCPVLRNPKIINFKNSLKIVIISTFLVELLSHYLYKHYGWLNYKVIIGTFVYQILFLKLYKSVISNLPHCFTLGEAFVVTSLMLMVTVTTIINIKNLLRISIGILTQNLRSKSFLIPYWTVCLSVMLYSAPSRNGSLLTLKRKHFHFFSLVIILPGIIDTPFLALALFLSLNGFIAIEFLRINAPGNVVFKGITKFYDRYRDDKDGLKFYLGHIYLCFGCLFSVFIQLGFIGTPRRIDDYLLMVSGVTALSVGDSMASFVGVKWGRIKMGNSLKTLEGMVGGFVSMSLFEMVLMVFLVKNGVQFGGINRLEKFFGPLIIVSMGEFLLTQFDNLFLPIIFCSAKLFFGSFCK